MKLPISFYQREDVVTVARNLLGKVLCTNINNAGLTSGVIVETEAYAGVTDKASHAFGGRRTNRTSIMYREGGVAYVYLIYGFYNLFNVISNTIDIPHAVLIRAIEPLEGIDLMMQRRNLTKLERKLTAGPGVLSQALGISRIQNGLSLMDDTIWIEDRGNIVSSNTIIESARINVSYAGDDALLPYRFRIKDNRWTSPGK